MKKKWAVVLSVVICAAVYAGAYCGGALCARNLPALREYSVLGIAAIAAGAFLAAELVAGMVCRIVTAKKNKRIDLHAQREELLQNKQQALSDYPRMRAGVRRAIGFVTFMHVVNTLLAFFTLFSLGLYRSESNAGAILAVSLLVFYFGYGLVLMWFGTQDRDRFAPDGISPLTEEAYPALLRMVNETAREASIRQKITVYLLPGCGLSVSDAGKHCYLYLGVLYFRALSADELKQGLLHEFGHAGNRDSELYNRLDRVMSRYGMVGSGFMTAFAQTVLFPWIGIAVKKWSIFSIVASAAQEQAADAFVRTHGDKAVYVSALAKINMLDIEMSEPAVEGKCLFASPTPCSDVETSRYETFLADFAQREALWRDLLSREIQGMFASHPTFRMRMEDMGEQDYTVSFVPVDSDDYQAEQKKALAYADALIEKDLKENYEANRKSAYLDPMERIHAYEAKIAAGEQLPLLDTVNIMEDYYGVLNYTATEALAEQILAQSPTNPQAHWFRGLLRLGRYDERGIDDIYAAIAESDNYIQSGYDAIGTFCCRMGLADRLEEYREKCLDPIEYSLNEWDDFSTVRASDHPEANTVPEPRLSGIIENAKKEYGNLLARLYIVHKRALSGQLDGNILITVPKPDVDRDAWNESSHRMFLYLDLIEDELYGLAETDSGSALEKLLAGIDGALVINNNEGDAPPEEAKTTAGRKTK